jgi:tetratricopeptide (TPR) repeat protein
MNAQPNCEAYKYNGDTLKYKACKKAEEIKGHYQFSRIFQQKLDEAIKIDSTFAYAYREKSVAYLKSGNFITWKTLIDKAVKFDPKDNLGYRGWCRYQFFRDYKGAIKDIEKLDSLVAYDLGTSVNGDYHLNIAKAICYKAIGQKQKAIKIIENQLISKDYYVGIFDYFHLGVWYLEDNQFKKSLKTFKKQLIENDLAEVHYYMALTYKKLKDFSNYKKQLEIAKTMYIENKVLFDGYTHHFDKIYLKDIEDEIKTTYNKVYKQ